MRKRFEISSRRVEAMESECVPLPDCFLAFSTQEANFSSRVIEFSFTRLQELRQRPVDVAPLKARLKAKCNELHGEMFKRFADMNLMFKVRLPYGLFDEYNTLYSYSIILQEWNMADIAYTTVYTVKVNLDY